MDQSGVVLTVGDELFRAFNAYSPVGFFALDPVGRNGYTNDRFQAISGLSSEEVDFEDWSAMIHPDDRVRALANWATVLRERSESEAEYRIIRPSDQTAAVRLIHVRTAPLLSADRALMGHIGTIEDLTESRAIEDPFRTIAFSDHLDVPNRGLIQGASDAIFITDDRARLLDANDSALSILGMTLQELLALGVAEVVARPAAWTEEEYARLIREGKWAGEVELQHKEGWRVPVDVRAKRIVFPGGTAYLTVARDLSARRRLEVVRQERERLARELHDSVSQVLYGIGLGTAGVEDAIGVDDQRARDGVDYMRSLVEVGMAEMRALLFELRSEALAEEGLVVALEKQASALRGRHGLDIVTTLGEEPAASLQVKEALYRVGQEAMANAIRHARARHVRLSLETRGDALALDVSDDGIGFTLAAVYPGHLGLRSMRERMLRLGGQLTIESAPGAGTRVGTEVPLLPPGDQLRHAPSERSSQPAGDMSSSALSGDTAHAFALVDPRRAGRSRHILIVDDHPDFLAFSRLAFQQRGCTVTTTTLLPRTFDMVSALLPDALIVSVDNERPEFRSLLKRLAHDPRTALIPLVIAGPNPAWIEEAQAVAGTAGPRATILYPLPPSDIAAIVERLLSSP